MFVSAIKGGGGTVLATAPGPSTWETFNIIRNLADPSMVHIQASNGMYLQVCNHHQNDHFSGLFSFDPYT
jgi:hypothetical protein